MPETIINMFLNHRLDYFIWLLNGNDRFRVSEQWALNIWWTTVGIFSRLESLLSLSVSSSCDCSPFIASRLRPSRSGQRRRWTPATGVKPAVLLYACGVSPEWHSGSVLCTRQRCRVRCRTEVQRYSNNLRRVSRALCASNVVWRTPYKPPSIAACNRKASRYDALPC